MNDDERRHAELTREALADVDTDLVVDWGVSEFLCARHFESSLIT